MKHININLRNEGQVIMYYGLEKFKIGNPIKLVQNLNENGSTGYFGITYSNINHKKELLSEFKRFSESISKEEGADVGWCDEDIQCRDTYDMFFPNQDSIVQTNYSIMVPVIN